MRLNSSIRMKVNIPSPRNQQIAVTTWGPGDFYALCWGGPPTCAQRRQEIALARSVGEKIPTPLDRGAAYIQANNSLDNLFRQRIS